MCLTLKKIMILGLQKKSFLINTLQWCLMVLFKIVKTQIEKLEDLIA